MINTLEANTKQAQRSQDEIRSNWGEAVAPLVSISCITYNHEAYIEDAIESLLMQETDFPFEILIHDDASTDGTANIIRQYEAKYPDIIRSIIQTENQFSQQGLINARIVFPKARGKYIALCEGDDYWTDKSKLQKQIKFLEDNPDYVITYTDSRSFDQSGWLETDFGGAKRDLSALELKKATPLYTLTTCFRNLIKEVPPDLMSARYGDLVMWSLLGQYGKGKYLDDIAPAAYRVHVAGLSSMKTIQQKYEMSVITKAALLAYYSRTGDAELARHFKAEVLWESLRALSWLETCKVLASALLLRIKLVVRKLLFIK